MLRLVRCAFFCWILWASCRNLMLGWMGPWGFAGGQGDEWSDLCFSFESSDVCHRRMEKNIQNKSTFTHNCFTPQQILKGAEVDPSNRMVLCMSVWKGCRGVLGAICPFKHLKKGSYSQGGKLLKAILRGFACSLLVSCSCLRVKIISVVDLPALNPAGDSG